TRRIRPSAGAARATCSATAKYGAPPDDPARRRGGDWTARAAGAVARARARRRGTGPGEQVGNPRALRVRRAAEPRPGLVRLHAGLQHGRGVQLPRRRRGMATLVLHRAGARGLGGDRLPAAPPWRADAV